MSFLRLYCASVLCCFSFCVCNPLIEEEASFFPPTKQGDSNFSVSIDSTGFPAYMDGVDDLTYRIPQSGTPGPFPVMVVEPGFFAQTTSLDDVQDYFASHGFLVAGVNNKSHFNLVTTSLHAYKIAYLQTIEYLVSCNNDSTHALFGIIDTTRIGICGHSMGGGGAILAADSLEHPYNGYISTVIAMNPFGTVSGSRLRVQVLLFSSDLDKTWNPFMPGVSSKPEDIYYTYGTIPATTTRFFANFADMDHNGVVDKHILLPTSGNAHLFLPLMVSWLKTHLCGDERYAPYLDPDAEEFAEIKEPLTTGAVVPAYAETQ